MDKLSLKNKLDYHYKYFDKTKISPDPLEFLHKYSETKDIEISGLISSVFAYGNVKQIISTLQKIHSIMKDKPYDFVLNYSSKTNRFKFVKHRFYSSDDIHRFFIALNLIYKSNSSLKEVFIDLYLRNDSCMKKTISEFSNFLCELAKVKNRISRGIKFMFPDPMKGSACKRMNLFLRWMVRKDELDFGLWNEIPTSKLIIPVDTHVAQICKRLKLTSKINVSWKMAEEITEKLKRFDEIDPVKYDFAICHIGMRKLEF